MKSNKRAPGLTDPWHNQGCSGAPGQTFLQTRRHHEKTNLCADDDAAIVQDRITFHPLRVGPSR
jgi:hypothetical protein